VRSMTVVEDVRLLERASKVVDDEERPPLLLLLLLPPCWCFLWWSRSAKEDAAL